MTLKYPGLVGFIIVLFGFLSLVLSIVGINHFGSDLPEKYISYIRVYAMAVCVWSVFHCLLGVFVFTYTTYLNGSLSQWWDLSLGVMASIMCILLLFLIYKFITWNIVPAVL